MKYMACRTVLVGTTVATEVGRLDGVGGSGLVSQEALVGEVGEFRSRGLVEKVVV